MIDPQIDPVTGLPISGDLGIIQQIPLGKQMFDWESYDATARMVRPPLYGDDVLPTVTNVQGQHPDTGSAQSIESDGNHRLKVASDFSGQSLALPTRHETMDGSWPVPESEASFYTQDNHPRYLLGISIALWTTVDTWVYVVIQTNFQSPGPAFSFYVTTAVPVNQTIMFPIPWDVYANYPSFPFQVDYRAKAQHLGARLTISTIYVDAGDLP